MIDLPVGQVYIEVSKGFEIPPVRQALAVTPPNHVVLRVEYCEPGAKGNTASNVTKPVKVETGAEFDCPSFVEMGDLIKVDTRTGEYIERVKE